MHTYLEPTNEAAVALFQRQINGPVTMLNLLALREEADYSDFPELDPGVPISGAAAFQRYVDHTLPFLHASGGTLTMLARGGRWFIGPEAEHWDIAMLVTQASVDAFVAFASDPAYMTGIGHRTAAVTDTRLLPLEVLDPGSRFD